MKRRLKIIIPIASALVIGAGILFSVYMFSPARDLKLYIHTADIAVSKVKFADTEGENPGYTSVFKKASDTWLTYYEYGPQQITITLTDGTTFIIEYYGADTGATVRRDIRISQTKDKSKLKITDTATMFGSIDVPNGTVDLFSGTITVKRGQTNTNPYRLGWL